MQYFSVSYNTPSTWVQRFYSATERCSYSGNVYECITVGDSTSPPIGTGADINPGGGAHFKFLYTIQYYDLESWARSISSQSEDFTVDVWGNGQAITIVTGGQIGFVGLYGWSSGGYTILIRGAPGDNFRETLKADSNIPLCYDETKGTAFECQSGDLLHFYIDVANVTFQGLQIRSEYNTGIIFCSGGNGSNLLVLDCIVDGYKHAYFSQPNQSLVNCLVFDRHTDSVMATADWPIKWDDQNVSVTGHNASGRVINCTLIGQGAVNSAVLCALGNPNQVVVSNSAFFGFDHPIFNQNALGEFAVDHCISDVANFDYPIGNYGCFDNGGNLFGRVAANQFFDAAANLRLKSGSDCIGRGITDLIDDVAGDDILGRNRSVPWDIGAAEYGLPAQLGYAGLGGAGVIAKAEAYVPSHGSSVTGTARLAASEQVISRPVAHLLATTLPNYRWEPFPPISYGQSDILGGSTITPRARLRAMASRTLVGAATVFGNAEIAGRWEGRADLLGGGVATGTASAKLMARSADLGAGTVLARATGVLKGRAQQSGVGDVDADAEVAVADPAWASLLRTDTNNVTLSTLASYPKPGYLGPGVNDPLFTQNNIPKIVRITGDPGTVTGPVTWGTAVYHNYFTHSPWNSDETILYLENNVGGSPSHIYLNGTTYAPLSPQPYHRSTGALWHPSRPKTMFWASGSAFGYTNDVTVGASTDVTLRTLAGYGSLSLGGSRGSVSYDGNVLPLLGTNGGTQVGFAYRVNDDTKWDDVTPAATLVSSTISPSGRYLEVRDSDNTLYVYDLASPPAATLVQTWTGGNPSYSDTARDTDGTEYAIGSMASSGSAIYKRAYATGASSNLQAIVSVGRFTSVRSRSLPQWVLASYDQTDTTHAYHGQVVAHNLAANRHVRLFQPNVGRNDYVAGQENACFSPSGSRVIFSSNWFNGSNTPVHTFVANLTPPPSGGEFTQEFTLEFWR